MGGSAKQSWDLSWSSEEVQPERSCMIGLGCLKENDDSPKMSLETGNLMAFKGASELSIFEAPLIRTCTVLRWQAFCRSRRRFCCALTVRAARQWPTVGREASERRCTASSDRTCSVRRYASIDCSKKRTRCSKIYRCACVANAVDDARLCYRTERSSTGN